MPRSNEAIALMTAARNRRRPLRRGWRYQEDYHQLTFGEAGDAFDNSEPIFISGECFRAGSSYYLRHDLRYQDPFHNLLISIHFMNGINGSNRMLVVTRGGQNVCAWVKLAQAMIKDLLVLNKNPAVIKLIGDVGEDCAYNLFEVLSRYFDHCVEGSSIVCVWLNSSPATWLSEKAG